MANLGYKKRRTLALPCLVSPSCAVKLFRIAPWTFLIVEADQRKAWEEYAWSNRYIVNETLRIMETDPNYYGPIPWDVPLKYSIHSDYTDVPYNESYVYINCIL